MDKTGAGILLMVIGGLIIPSALFLLMTGQTTNKVEQVIMTIVDEGPNQDQVMQTQFVEKNPKTLYLERSNNWVEVEKEDQAIGFLQSTELTILDVTFTDTVGNGSGDCLIVVSFSNYGTKDATITQVNFNGITQNGNWELTSGKDIIEPGDLETIQLTSEWTKGNKYSIKFVTTDGTIVGYYINAIA